MISAAEVAANFFQRMASQVPCQVHAYLPRVGDRLGPPLALQVCQPNVETRGYRVEYLLDRYILRLAHTLGVEFAYPTQTVWLERSRKPDGAEPVAFVPGKDDPCVAGLDQAAAVFADAYGEVPTPRSPVVIERAPQSKHKRDANA